MTIPEMLQEIWELVDEKVEYPECLGAGMTEVKAGVYCWKCHGDKQVPNTAYDPLREVVSEKIWGQLITNKYGAAVGMEEGGYIPRSWEGMPEGALGGALMYAMGDCPSLIEAGCRATGESYAHVRQVADRWFVQQLGQIFDSHNPDLAAAEAVIAALSAQRTPGAEKEQKDD